MYPLHILKVVGTPYGLFEDYSQCVTKIRIRPLVVCIARQILCYLWFCT